MPSITLVTAAGELAPYQLGSPLSLPPVTAPPAKRIAYSAAHVVADPLRTVDPWCEATIDWDATMAYRHHLWSLGLGVAEAMDTAQRGMGLDWQASLELIRRSLTEAKAFGPTARIACGAGTDQLDPADANSIDDVIAAYEEQCAAIEALDGSLILMASRALAKVAKSPDDYLTVYDRILSQVREPVILHWLGDMFDPALTGYWGNTDLDAAMDLCLQVIANSADKVDGIKISLLDKDKEIAMRRRLPGAATARQPGSNGTLVEMYTGDDFNYPELIAGDDKGYSHALLGIFDAIAPAAAAALQELDAGNTARFHEILAPTVPLSRHIFQAPTRFYKTGVVFMAWLNGHQNHFQMIGGSQSARSVGHFCELFRLADKAGLLTNPELAAQRMSGFLAVNGVA